MDKAQHDLIMAELHALSAFTRGDAMVGMYLRYFSEMENALNEVIRRATNMGHMESVLLLRHFDFYRKTQALSALVAKCIDDNEKRKGFHRTITQASELAEQRNIIAHSRFAPHGDLGLQIRKVHSSKNPSFAPIIWTVEGFFQHLDVVWQLQLKFENMSGFESVEDIWYRDIERNQPTAEEAARTPQPPSPPPEY